MFSLFTLSSQKQKDIKQRTEHYLVFFEPQLRTSYIQRKRNFKVFGKYNYPHTPPGCKKSSDKWKNVTFNNDYLFLFLFIYIPTYFRHGIFGTNLWRPMSSSGLKWYLFSYKLLLNKYIHLGMGWLESQNKNKKECI